MLSEFHRIKMGLFSFEHKNIALDYKSLYEEPLQARMTIMHELTHNVLTNLTDYGLGTLSLFEIKGIFKKVNKPILNLILEHMVRSQLKIQESTATFIEMSHLKRCKGALYTQNFADSYLPDDYKERFIELKSIFNSSKKYTDSYTSKIPLASMNNGFRHNLVSSKISSIEDLRSYILEYEDVPDKRYEKLLESVIKSPSILLEDIEDICRFAGIKFYAETSKKDVCDFLNCILSFTDIQERYQVEDIKDSRSVDQVIISAAPNFLITNLNINLVSTGETLLKVQDFLFYKDIFQAVMISELDVRDDEKIVNLETILRKTYTAGIIAFTNQVSKYMYPSSHEDISDLINKQLSSIPLIVKWGLYNPNGNWNAFKINRFPDAVIYNYSQDLIDQFSKFKPKSKLKYIQVSTSFDHPFQTFLLVDSNNVLHTVNGFPIELEKITNKLKNYIEIGEIDDFKNQKNIINKVMYIWNGLELEYDWFGSFKKVAS